jgi:hypothetical protein
MNLASHRESIRSSSSITGSRIPVTALSVSPVGTIHGKANHDNPSTASCAQLRREGWLVKWVKWLMAFTSGNLMLLTEGLAVGIAVLEFCCQHFK